ncbi:MAG: phosphoribosylanthranilate isomerase [Christensenellaceae bacterium]|nr:phosphoribosylanthranilate isomerase [Christensenellaceae bacterium]
MNVRIQIAGIRTLEDAMECVKNGVDSIGLLVGQSHTSKDFISKQTARDIVTALPPYQVSTLITHVEKADEIVNLVRFIGVGCVQLHSYIKESEVQKIRKTLPNTKIIRLIHVQGGGYTDYSQMKLADAYFTDSINTETGQVGGTGLVHDFEQDKKIRETIIKPLIIAGGLNSKNVAEIIKLVKPYGVDTNSGCKGKNGRMDYKRLKEFCDAVRSVR